MTIRIRVGPNPPAECRVNTPVGDIVIIGDETLDRGLVRFEAEWVEPVDRCIMCGHAVTPGSLIGNALANGAMPRMAEHAIKSTRLYTDELGALRKRVAELEAGLPAAWRALSDGQRRRRRRARSTTFSSSPIT